MNSTPSIPSSIRRLTALPPAPPTPITFILAPFVSSKSAKVMRSDRIPSLPSENIKNLHHPGFFQPRRTETRARESNRFQSDNPEKTQGSPLYKTGSPCQALSRTH